MASEPEVCKECKGVGYFIIPEQETDDGRFIVEEVLYCHCSLGQNLKRQQGL